MAQDPGRLNVPSGGAGMPQELLDALTAGLASTTGAQQQPANRNIVPLWRTRPEQVTERINPGQFGDDNRSSGGGRVTGGRVDLDLTAGEREAFTPDFAASSYLDMKSEERAEFERLAVGSGLAKPNSDPNDIASAWDRAVGYAANYNKDRAEGEWISPWEAVERLGAEQAARNGGAYDPFKPRTTRDSRTITRNFTSGNDAEAVTRTLESLFNSQMGRAPTAQERESYQKLVQVAYDANPEVTNSTTTTDSDGNSSTDSEQTGGVDMTATLLDQVRSDPESTAFEAGSTFFEAAMGALGAIA